MEKNGDQTNGGQRQVDGMYDCTMLYTKKYKKKSWNHSLINPPKKCNCIKGKEFLYYAWPEFMDVISRKINGKS